MNDFFAFSRNLRAATAGLEPEAIQRELAMFARAELAGAIASGEGSRAHERYVDGRKGASEDSVKVPGEIVYLFAHWRDVIEAAIAELVKRSPRKSGRYRASYIVVADGRLVTDYEAIPAEAEVIIVNWQPYTRLLNAGAAKGTGRKHFDLAAKAMNRHSRFGNSFVTEHLYLNMPTGIHPAIPYVLKRDARLRRAKTNRRSSAFRQGRAFLAQRKDLMAGVAITYPALVINLYR